MVGPNTACLLRGPLAPRAATSCRPPPALPPWWQRRVRQSTSILARMYEVRHGVRLTRATARCVKRIRCCLPHPPGSSPNTQVSLPHCSLPPWGANCGRRKLVQLKYSLASSVPYRPQHVPMLRQLPPARATASTPLDRRTALPYMTRKRAALIVCSPPHSSHKGRDAPKHTRLACRQRVCSPGSTPSAVVGTATLVLLPSRVRLRRCRVSRFIISPPPRRPPPAPPPPPTKT